MGARRRCRRVLLGVAGNSFTGGEMMQLSAPSNDAAATSGVTLGGSAIGDDASWNGKWTAISAPNQKGEFELELPPATAAIVRLSK